MFITGASKGIGRETALSFAKAGAAAIGVGARSDFGDIEGEIHEAAKQAGRAAPRVHVVRLDVTDRESLSQAAAEIEKVFGRLDILINNAGIVESPFQKIVDIDPDVWWNTLDVNLRGVYFCTRAFLPLLLRSEGGEKTIINVGSVAQNYLLPGASAYGISKLGVARFTEFIDTEYASEGILAYTIHPGAVETHLGKRLPAELTKGWMNDKEPLAADTLVFLTQERRDWLAGRYVSATWDMTELMSRKDEIVNDNKLKVRMLI